MAQKADIFLFFFHVSFQWLVAVPFICCFFTRSTCSPPSSPVVSVRAGTGIGERTTNGVNVRLSPFVCRAYFTVQCRRRSPSGDNLSVTDGARSHTPIGFYDCGRAVTANGATRAENKTRKRRQTDAGLPWTDFSVTENSTGDGARWKSPEENSALSPSLGRRYFR